jgi:hypothetical protein
MILQQLYCFWRCGQQLMKLKLKIEINKSKIGSLHSSLVQNVEQPNMLIYGHLISTLLLVGEVHVWVHFPKGAWGTPRAWALRVFPNTGECNSTETSPYVNNSLTFLCKFQLVAPWSKELSEWVREIVRRKLNHEGDSNQKWLINTKELFVRSKSIFVVT